MDIIPAMQFLCYGNVKTDMQLIQILFLLLLTERLSIGGNMNDE